MTGLVSVREGRLQTMALAGSAPRGGHTEQDQELAAALLDSAKDNSEHRMVIDAIVSGLRPHCQAMEVAPSPVLHRLPHLQHLLTPISAHLKSGSGLLAVAQALHPTPAVGGLPRQGALDYIRRREQLDRGWYAGPVGWLDERGNGEWVVALRCALLQDRHATLFAGCGLVEHSELDSEYRESELKMQTMQDALRPAAS